MFDECDLLRWIFKIIKDIPKTYTGSAEIWTRIAGFRVQSANHYTTEPLGDSELTTCTKPLSGPGRDVFRIGAYFNQPFEN